MALIFFVWYSQQPDLTSCPEEATKILQISNRNFMECKRPHMDLENNNECYNMEYDNYRSKWK